MAGVFGGGTQASEGEAMMNGKVWDTMSARASRPARIGSVWDGVRMDEICANELVARGFLGYVGMEPLRC